MVQIIKLDTCVCRVEQINGSITMIRNVNSRGKKRLENAKNKNLFDSSTPNNRSRIDGKQNHSILLSVNNC